MFGKTGAADPRSDECEEIHERTEYEKLKLDYDCAYQKGLAA